MGWMDGNDGECNQRRLAEMWAEWKGKGREGQVDMQMAIRV